MLNALRKVNGQHIDGRPADGSAANKHRTSPSEVLLPGIPARVEEPGNLARFRINSCYIWSFIRVVVVAAQGQVVACCWAVVFLGNDVVNLERQDVKALGKVAVLAGVLSTVPDELPQGLVHRSVVRARWSGQANTSLGLYHIE